MKYKVRNANIDDLDSLVKFIITEANEAEGIIKPPNTVLKGIKAGLENPDIQSMFLMPDYRGIGLLETLLEEIKLAAKNEGAIELRLYVHKENNRAIKAYKKVGFCISDYKMMIWEL